ncbi:MAG TPA: hypothetical protein VMT18_16075 [Planctomycetota bacterium]|nr:hypothetical protein [Planctomycetota bacterium]
MRAAVADGQAVAVELAPQVAALARAGGHEHACAQGEVEVLAGDLLDHRGEHGMARVGVRVARPRLELERRLEHGREQVVARRSHGSSKGLFVWTKASGAQVWTHKTASAFKAFDLDQFKKGRRLTCLSLGFGL